MWSAKNYVRSKIEDLIKHKSSNNNVTVNQSNLDVFLITAGIFRTSFLVICSFLKHKQNSCGQAKQATVFPVKIPT